MSLLRGEVANPVPCRWFRAAGLSILEPLSWHSAPQHMLLLKRSLRGSMADSADNSPCRPAILVLHHWGWWNALGDGIDRGLFYSQPEGQLTAFSHVSLPAGAQCAATALLLPDGAFRSQLAWHHVPRPPRSPAAADQQQPPPSSAKHSPDLAMLSRRPAAFNCWLVDRVCHPFLPRSPVQYYDLPTLSLRSAAYHLMDAGLPKFQANAVLLRHCSALLATMVLLVRAGRMLAI